MTSGAARATKSPPARPPLRPTNKNCVRIAGCGRCRASSPWQDHAADEQGSAERRDQLGDLGIVGYQRSPLREEKSDTAAEAEHHAHRIARFQTEDEAEQLEVTADPQRDGRDVCVIWLVTATGGSRRQAESPIQSRRCAIARGASVADSSAAPPALPSGNRCTPRRTAEAMTHPRLLRQPSAGSTRKG